MLSKKREGFILFTAIFILTLMPGVFALLEYLYYPTDPIALYQQFQGWADIIIITVIVTLIFQALIPRVFGKEEETKHVLEKLAIVIGLAAGLSLSYFGRNIAGGEGPILGLGPFWLLLGLFALFFKIYQSAKGEEGKMGWGATLFIFLLTLFLASLLFPETFSPVAESIFEIPLLRILFAVLAVGSGIALLLWLVTKIFGGRRVGRGEREISREQQETSGRPKPPKEPKLPKLRASIYTTPPGPYRPLDSVTLEVVIEEKRGLLRGWGRARGTFACNWEIKGIGILNDHNTNTNWQVPQTMQASQIIKIYVTAQDTENSQRAPIYADTEIEVRGGVPKLIITKPVDTSRGETNLIKNIGEDIIFDYILDTREAAPEGVVDAAWLYVQGHQTEITKKILNQTKIIGKGTNLHSNIGLSPFNVKEGGIYTIICVAVDKKGKYYKIPIIDKYLESHFTLTVKAGRAAPSPTPQPQPAPTPGKAKFFLNVTKENNKKTEQVGRYSNDFQLDSVLTRIAYDVFYFEPQVENDDIRNYEIEITSDMMLHFGYDKKTRKAYAEIMSPNPKIIQCTFKKKGGMFKKDETVATITATINVREEKAGVAEFWIYIYKQNPVTKKSEPFAGDNKNLKFNAKVSEIYFLLADVKKDIIANYNIEWRLSGVPTIDIFADRKGNKFSKMIQLNIPGTKEIVCTFRNKANNSVAASISTIINASPEEAVIKITKINGRKVSTGQTLTLKLGPKSVKGGKKSRKNLVMEAEVNKRSVLDYFFWQVQEEGGQKENLGRQTAGKVELLGRDRVVTPNTKAEFVYDMFTEEYFKSNTKYILWVYGEKGELWKEGGKGEILKNNKGKVITDFIYIITEPA